MGHSWRYLAIGAFAALGSCSYLKNRANDLLDSFRFELGVGPGLYAEARATDFAAVGLGFCAQQNAAMRGRFAGTDAEVTSMGLGPFILGSSATWSFKPLLAGDPSTPESCDGIVPAQFLLFPMMGFGSCADDYSLAERGLRVADLGASVTLGYVGAGIGFSPGEFVDLLLGFVGIDIAGDDVFGRATAAEAPPTSGTPAPASPGSPR